MDTECDNHGPLRCKEQYPNARPSWCEGCLNTLIERPPAPEPSSAALEGNNLLDTCCPIGQNPPVDRSGRLWSLWDMLKFRAADFCEIANTLGWMRAQGEDDLPLIGKHTVIEEPIYSILKGQLANARRHCLAVGLGMAVRYIDDPLLTSLRIGAPLRQWLSQLEELERRMRDELQSELVLRIRSDHAKWYRTPRNKWREIIIAFPNIVTDVEEAGKCFACERYAAAVHHTLLIVEHGLNDLGTRLGVNDHRSGWTSVTNRLQQIIKAKHEDRPPYAQKHFNALEQIHGTVEVLKNAWRNKVDHAQNVLRLMTSDFTPEVAEEIMLATRAFMRRLATELPRVDITS